MDHFSVSATTISVILETKQQDAKRMIQHVCHSHVNYSRTGRRSKTALPSSSEEELPMVKGCEWEKLEEI